MIFDDNSNCYCLKIWSELLVSSLSGLHQVYRKKKKSAPPVMCWTMSYSRETLYGKTHADIDRIGVLITYMCLSIDCPLHFRAINQRFASKPADRSYSSPLSPAVPSGKHISLQQWQNHGCPKSKSLVSQTVP
jgi:hypothetical protein